MQTRTFSDPLYNDLCRLDAPYGLSSNEVYHEYRKAFPTPATVPPEVVPPAEGYTEAQIRLAAAQAGFDRCIYEKWDWNAGPNLVITTERHPQGPIGPNGIVIVEFTVPANANVGKTNSFSVAPYPGDLQSCIRTVSLSLSPADFHPPPATGSPNDQTWTGSAPDAPMRFCVAPYTGRPGMFAPLEVGGTYFYNFTSRHEDGTSSCSYSGRACDVRITATVP